MTELLRLFLLTSAMPGFLGDNTDDLLPIEKTAVATINLKGYPDWLEIGYGSLWVSNAGVGAVQRIDPETNKVIAEVKINNPAAAMAVGFESLWVASGKDKSIC